MFVSLLVKINAATFKFYKLFLKYNEKTVSAKTDSDKFLL